MSGLSALGPHIGAHVAAHHQGHQQKIADEHKKRNTHGKTERQLKANALRAPLGAAIFAENISNSNELRSLRSRSLGVLESGAHASGTISFACVQDNYNDEILDHVTNNPQYLDQGLTYSEYYHGQRLDEEIARSLDTGINVRLGLHSEDEVSGARTDDAIPVGTILDPESILVPEVQQEGEDGMRFAVIGPDDARFGAIIDMALTLADPQTPLH
jgi:hypothetical protein